MEVSNNMRNPKTLRIAVSAVIAAAYAALTIALAPISYGAVQFRVSEVLTIMPFLVPSTVTGIFVGCILANLMGGNHILDVVFGSLATLLGALGTRKLRNAHPLLAPVPPIIANTLIVPFVLRYAYGIPGPIPLMMLTVGIGEVLSCGVLGMLLYFALYKRREAVFRSHQQENA